MTGIALIGTGDMAGTLARGHDIVVTTDAVAQYLTVIHATGRHRNPLGRQLVMAQLAQVGRCDMRR